MRELFNTKRFKEAIAEPGTEDWAKRIREKMQRAVDQEEEAEFQFRDEWAEFVEHQGWSLLGFMDYREFCLAVRPSGLAMTEKQYRILCENAALTDKDAIAKAREQTNPESPEHIKPKGRPESGKRSHNNVMTSPQGNTTEYTLRRFCRDIAKDEVPESRREELTELLDEIERGEKSVNAAAIQAGYRKVDTPDEKALKALRKADNPAEVIEQYQAELAEVPE